MKNSKERVLKICEIHWYTHFHYCWCCRETRCTNSTSEIFVTYSSFE